MAVLLLRRLGLKVVDYGKTLVDNYWTVVKETAEDCRARKLRSLAIFSGIGFGVYCIRSNPTEEEFANRLVEDRLELGQISPYIRNPASDSLMQERTELLNQRRLQRLNLIFLSLMLRKDFSPENDQYAAQCGSLRPKWNEWPERIVDVGAFGRWFWAERAMADYDINPQDFIGVEQ